MIFTKKIVICVIVSGIIFVVFQFHLSDKLEDANFQAENLPVILWWTPFVNEKGTILECGDVQCFSTQNRSLHQKTKAILFYGSDLKIEDLPLPRLKTELWGLMHEESLRNNPIFAHQTTLNLFNFSSTFSRYSDVPLTLTDLPTLEAISSTKHFVSLESKNLMIEKNELAPVLYIQSDCDTASDRDFYISELMKYTKVDSYGSCLNNRQLPNNLKTDYVSKLYDEEFLSFVARYKFTLAFENAICDDYVTEKLWRPLIVGSVPVYYGSPSFKDWLPNENSAISVTDFPGPEELANLINSLSDDEQNYTKYLDHKLLDIDNGIRNHRLLDALSKRKNDHKYGFDKYVEEFQCHVCRRIQKSESEKSSIVSGKVYNCPVPESEFGIRSKRKNPWTLQWKLGKCAAKLLKIHVDTNRSVVKKDFEDEKLRMYEDGNC